MLHGGSMSPTESAASLHRLYLMHWLNWLLDTRGHMFNIHLLFVALMELFIKFGFVKEVFLHWTAEKMNQIGHITPLCDGSIR